MAVLFFKHNEEEPIQNQEDKLGELFLLLQTYNLIAHDDQENRSEGLQAILDHLNTMSLTPSLRQWIENDLTEHLDDYDLTSELTSAKPPTNF
jgi:hypothetical protein